MGSECLRLGEKEVVGGQRGRGQVDFGHVGSPKNGGDPNTAVSKKEGAQRIAEITLLGVFSKTASHGEERRVKGNQIMPQAYRWGSVWVEAIAIGHGTLKGRGMTNAGACGWLWRLTAEVDRVRVP